MKPLPVPLRSVLRAEADEASVARTWARVQLTRRAPRDWSRPVRLAAVSLALVAAVAAPWWVGRFGAVPASAPTSTEPAGPALRGRHLAPLPARPAGPTSSSPDVAPAFVPPEVDSVGDLMASAQDAWRAQQPARVLSLLGEVVAHHADDPRVPEALYVMGLVELDTFGHPRVAQAHFRRALELGPPEALVGAIWEASERAQGQLPVE